MRLLFPAMAVLNSVQVYGRLRKMVSSLRTVSIVSLLRSSVQRFPMTLNFERSWTLNICRTYCSTDAFETGIERMCCKSFSKLGAFSFLKNVLHFSSVLPYEHKHFCWSWMTECGILNVAEHERAIYCEQWNWNRQSSRAAIAIKGIALPLLFLSFECA